MKQKISSGLTLSITCLASFVSVSSILMQLSLIHFSTAFGFVSPRVVIFFVETMAVLSYLFVPFIPISQVSCSRCLSTACWIEPILEAAVNPIAADIARPMPIEHQLENSTGLLKSGICTYGLCTNQE